MIRINKNLIKRIYASFKENIVTIIVIVAVLLGGISILSILTDENLVNGEEDFNYEEYTAQRIGISNIKTLDPIASTDRDTYHIDQLIYSYLFDFDNNFGLIKDLVKSYKTNPDNGSVSLTLRSGVRFSKGQELTAEDVVYTYYYILQTGTKSLYYDMASTISNISATGKYKLKVQFNDPLNASLDNLTFPILNKGDAEKEGTFIPNGSGMYKVGKYKRGHYIKLVPNKKYYGEIPKNSVFCQVFPKTTVVENLITTYDVTAEFYPDFNGLSIAEDKGLTHAYIPSNNMEYLGFNFSNPILANKDFRKAIAYSIDLNELIKLAYGDSGLVCDSIYFPNYYNTGNNGDLYDPSVSETLQIMEKLKFADTNDDGYLEDQNGEIINLKILVNDDASRLLVANTISDNLDELQIRNEVVRLDWDSYKRALRSGDFDLVIGGYQINSNDKLRFMFDESNYIGYQNERVTELVNKLYSCNSIENYKKTYTNLKAVLSDELPYYCLCYKQYSLLGTPKMEFEQLPNYDNAFRGINTWKYKKIINEE